MTSTDTVFLSNTSGHVTTHSLIDLLMGNHTERLSEWMSVCVSESEVCYTLFLSGADRGSL